MTIELYSREWWNGQFEQSWERCGGPGQTRHFMEGLVANLDDRERDYLGGAGASILDWGCAMGDGVDLLAQQFPAAVASGLDVSDVAIDAARRRFPALTFAAGELQSRWDVIVTSNCIEHFQNPWDMVRRHLTYCNDVYAVLVPFREWPLMSGHFHAFSPGSFPECVNGFVRLSERTFETAPEFWRGSQILTVYGSQSYVERQIAAGRIAPGTLPALWIAWRDAAPDARAALDGLAEAHANAVTRIGELELERAQHVHRLGHLAEREKGIAFLQHLVGVRDEKLRARDEQIATLEAELQTLRNK